MTSVDKPLAGPAPERRKVYPVNVVSGGKTVQLQHHGQFPLPWESVQGEVHLRLVTQMQRKGPAITDIREQTV